MGEALSVHPNATVLAGSARESEGGMSGRALGRVRDLWERDRRTCWSRGGSDGLRGEESQLEINQGDSVRGGPAWPFATPGGKWNVALHAVASSRSGTRLVESSLYRSVGYCQRQSKRKPPSYTP